MPCWTRVESKVEFLAASTNVDLLDAALVAMGHKVARTSKGLAFTKGWENGSYEASTGRLTAYQSLDTQAVKRGYSEQVVAHTARKNGWQASVVYPAYAPVPDGEIRVRKTSPLWLLDVAGPFSLLANRKRIKRYNFLNCHLTRLLDQISKMLLLPCSAWISPEDYSINILVLITREEKALVAGEVYAGLVRNRKGRR